MSVHYPRLPKLSPGSDSPAAAREELPPALGGADGQVWWSSAGRAESANPDWLREIREWEIEEARLLQQGMIPAEPLRHPATELAWEFQPVDHVGGDFLDFFRLNGEQVGFYVGDVAGKGLPAAMYGALAAGTLRGIHKTGLAPATLLEVLNQRLRFRPIPGRFCAVLYGLFDATSRELRYAMAGFPPPLHITANGCRVLDGWGLPSAMFDHPRYEAFSVRLAAGESVLISSDGLVEARNREGEEFGTERLLEVCSQNVKESAAVLLNRVFAEVRTFCGALPQRDDITAAVLRSV